MFQKISDFISSNPIMIIVIFAITVVGFVVTLYSAFQSRKPKLVCSIETIDLLNNSLLKKQELDIRFKGTPITQLSVSKIEIRNGGKFLVQGSSFYDGHELSVECLDHCKILSVDITNQSSDTIKATLDGNIIRFDTLEEKERINLLVYHSCDNSIHSEIKVTGKMRGGKILRSGLSSQDREMLINSLVGPWWAVRLVEFIMVRYFGSD